MMKQNTYFKGDGGSSIDLLIKNSKDKYDKFLWNSFVWSSSHDINYSQKKNLKSLNQRNQ